MPRVINVDKNPAYPRAVEDLKARRSHQPQMPTSSMQVLKQCRGAKSPQRKTPNVAGERLRFAADSMAADHKPATVRCSGPAEGHRHPAHLLVLLTQKGPLNCA